MKTQNPVAKTITFLIIAGILFFSCARNNIDDYGTLVIRLPGSNSGARAAVSPEFTATLAYRIECSGPGSVSREEKSGSSVSIPLNEGDWTVTVTVLNAARQPIGSGTAPALIESGKTTTVQIPVGIDTSGNSITKFEIVNPAAIGGLINAAANTIEVTMPYGTIINSMDFNVTHTGASITPPPGTSLNFSSPRTFTVRAENSTPRTYTVTVKIAKLPGPTIPTDPLPAVPTGVWPEDTIWQPYGLAGITQPGETGIIRVDNTSGKLAVYLLNADKTSLDNIIRQVESRFSKTGTVTPGPGYNFYEFYYIYGSKNYTLTLTHVITNSTIYMVIEGG
jgi:hypothetical protein